MEKILIIVGAILITFALLYMIYEKMFSIKINGQKQLMSFNDTYVSELFIINLSLRCDYYTKDEPDFENLMNWWVNVSFDECMESIAKKEYMNDDSSQVRLYQRRASILGKYFTTQDNTCYFSSDLISFMMNNKHDSKKINDLTSIFIAYYDYMLKNKIIKNVLIEKLKLKENNTSTNLSYNIAKKEMTRHGLLPVDDSVLSNNMKEVFASELIYHDELKKYYDTNKINEDINVVGCYILYDTHIKKYYIGHSTKILSEIYATLYSPETNNPMIKHNVEKGHKFLIRIIPFYMTGYKSIHKLERELIAAYKISDQSFETILYPKYQSPLDCYDDLIPSSL